MNLNDINKQINNYMSPELINNIKQNDIIIINFDIFKSNIFSIGLLILIINYF